MKQAILNDNDIHNIIIISDNFQFNCQDSGIGNVNYGSDLIREIVSRCDGMKKYNMEFFVGEKQRLRLWRKRKRGDAGLLPH